MDGLIDWSLLATLGLIFGATLLGAFLRSNRRDVCLKAFNGYHVTLERTNGKIVWGIMDLETTGFELFYRDTIQDANHVESSYVLYATEFEEIQAIFRYVDDLNERQGQRELLEKRRSCSSEQDFIGISERATGFEPVMTAWEAVVLPLHHARIFQGWLEYMREGAGCQVRRERCT